MKALLRGWATLALAVALAGCLGGGSSSETDGLRPPGTVEITPGKSSLYGRTDAGNAVSIYSVHYNPFKDSGFSDSAVADSRGDFAFRGVPAGEYNLVVSDPATGKAAFLDRITVAPYIGGAVRSDTLAPTGGLRGAIRDSLIIVNVQVHLEGTPFKAKADSAGGYEFSGIPAGDYVMKRIWQIYRYCPTICGTLILKNDSADVRFESGATGGDPP